MASVEILGLNSLKAKLDALPATVEAAIEKAQTETAFEAQNAARLLVQRGVRSGRLYKRGKKRHRASAPGEPPKTDSGALVARIRGGVERRLTAVISAGTKYAEYLEVGTRKMGARPFLSRAVNAVLPRAKERLVRYISIALRRMK
jgi:HK97 gp10 family phage protein